MLADRFGMSCDAFPFGADTNTYHLRPAPAAAGVGSDRTGVVFYAKPHAARRAYDLGILALGQFSRTHPHVEIHLFGDRVRDLPFPATGHGQLTPAQLNELYNRCLAGLSLSMTNVSLIPWELLAAGAIPVVNDAVHNRRVLANPEVVWARATPQGLADALRAVVDGPAALARATAANTSVQGVSWETASRHVVEAVERACRGRTSTRRV